MNGFRKMISDNIPKTWDIALRWCRCRQDWIETTYNIYVGRYNDDYRSKKEIDKLKSDEVKRITHSMKINGEYMLFKDTVNLNPEDKDNYRKWKKVCDWVKWFEESFIYICSTIKVQRECKSLSDEELITLICKRYGLNTDLTKHIIKYAI